MDKALQTIYDELFEKYQNSNLISYASPDQFQYRQNQLLQALTEVILFPYLIEKQVKEQLLEDEND